MARISAKVVTCAVVLALVVSKSWTASSRQKRTGEFFRLTFSRVQCGADRNYVREVSEERLQTPFAGLNQRPVSIYCYLKEVMIVNPIF